MHISSVMLLWTLNIIMCTISGHHRWLKLCILYHTVPMLLTPAPCVIASCVYLVGPVYSTRHAGADFVSLKFLFTCPSTLSLSPSLPPSSFLPPSPPPSPREVCRLLQDVLLQHSLWDHIRPQCDSSGAGGIPLLLHLQCSEGGGKP